MMPIVFIVAAFVGVAALVGGVAVMLRGDGGSPTENRLEMLAAGGGAGVAKTAAKNEKTLLTQPLDAVPNLIETFVSRFANLRVLLAQADMNISPGKFSLICIAVGGAAGAACAFSPAHILFAPVAGLFGSMLPCFWLWFKRGKRLSDFGKQLPDALELMSRALRAGHSLASGIALVASEMSDPISKEFRRVFEEQNLGIPIEDALDSMTDRVPNLDLRFFATAIILQRQTGGDLAEILDKIGHLIRERFKLFGAIQALTGEGRLSGIVLLALPPTLFIVMFRLNPDYVMMLFEDPLGKQMLVGAVVLQILGAVVIRKIINIKV